MREIARALERFSTFTTKRKRKYVIIVSEATPRESMEEYVDLGPRELCDDELDSPSRDQIRVAAEMADANMVVLSSWSDVANNYWKQNYLAKLPVDYYAVNGQYNIKWSWWDQLRQRCLDTRHTTSAFTCSNPPDSAVDIFLITDSSHTEQQQAASLYASYYLPKFLNSRFPHYQISYALYSSGLLTGQDCFLSILPLSPSINSIDLNHFPMCEFDDTDQTTFLPGISHITKHDVNPDHLNIILYATDKFFVGYEDQSATTRSADTTCPLEMPQFQSVVNQLHDTKTSVIVGLGISQDLPALTAQWTEAISSFPNTSNILEVTYSRRTYAYDALMAVVAGACGDKYDTEETHTPPGFLPIVKTVAPIVVGVGAAAGIFFTGVAIWEIFKPPRQLSFTMEGSGEAMEEPFGDFQETAATASYE